jgi:hypothetical protein
MNKKIKNPALQAAGKKGAAVRYGQDYGGPRLEDMPRDAEGGTILCSSTILNLRQNS